jgi:hypothetical protein
MMLRKLFFLLLAQLPLASHAQGEQVLFYNVENLFHPSNDSTMESDDPYTPEGSHEWNYYRYRRKLSSIFKTIAAVGEGDTPTVMGFAELEERRVLEDLVRQTPLRDDRLCILQYPSPDHRGMDVGMIYRRDRFEPARVQRLRVDIDEKGASPTREILYVDGSLLDSIQLHLFVCHWPSRYGGRARSEWKRVEAAKTLRTKIERIQAKDPEANILVMGDLNDTPRDRSIRDVLKAGQRWKERDPTPWYDLMAGLERGSYFHGGHWSFLDHFLVPRRMAEADSASSLKVSKPRVHRKPWLLKERRAEGRESKIPHRTFSGPAYIGGISDHLPVSVKLRLK